MVNGIYSFILKSFHRAEPLLRGTEKNGMLAAPAMGILVHDFFLCPKNIAIDQGLQNGYIGFIGGQSCKFPGKFVHFAVFIYGNHDVFFQERIVLANNKVFNTMTGGSMHAACTAFQGHMVAKDKVGFFIHERMLTNYTFQFCAGECGEQGAFAFKFCRS